MIELACLTKLARTMFEIILTGRFTSSNRKRWFTWIKRSSYSASVLDIWRVMILILVGISHKKPLGKND